MVEILLATHNSTKYLAQQIDSIIAQEYTDWHLFIRDDGSSDSTLAMIKDYIASYPDKITLLPSSGDNIGVVRNFGLLLEASTAPYVMFCDHDDVWLPNKIAVEMEHMRDVEKRIGHDQAVLVFTDLVIVDEQLHWIADSFYSYSNLSHSDYSFHRLLFYFNWILGCTMMFNRKLIDCCGKIPVEALWHDEWITYVAVLFGHISFCPGKVIYYRQHGFNLSEGVTRTGFKNMFKVFLSLKKVRKIFKRRTQQNKTMAALYHHLLENDNRLRALEDFGHLPECPWWKRGKIIFRHGWKKVSLWRMTVIWILSRIK